MPFHLNKFWQCPNWHQHLAIYDLLKLVCLKVLAAQKLIFSGTAVVRFSPKQTNGLLRFFTRIIGKLTSSLSTLLLGRIYYVGNNNKKINPSRK